MPGSAIPRLRSYAPESTNGTGPPRPHGDEKLMLGPLGTEIDRNPSNQMQLT